MSEYVCLHTDQWSADTLVCELTSDELLECPVIYEPVTTIADCRHLCSVRTDFYCTGVYYSSAALTCCLSSDAVGDPVSGCADTMDYALKIRTGMSVLDKRNSDVKIRCRPARQGRHYIVCSVEHRPRSSMLPSLPLCERFQRGASVVRERRVPASSGTVKCVTAQYER